MKRLPGTKDIDIPLTNGVLDGRTSAGEANATDFRLLLNTSAWDERGRSRLPGWVARRSATPSNEDLHDQLLLGSPGAAVREAIVLMGEVTSSLKTKYAIAATKSRIYASTGMGRNWRMLADRLGGPDRIDDQWPVAQMRMAQVGDIVLFSNGLDPVLAWPIGGAPITTGPNGNREWSAFEVYDLLGLSITRASVIASWGGFAFIADVVVDGEAYSSRVYWSDFNRPLEWAPGGESSAGYTDLGRGERVLAILPISGHLRCYTDKAIYSVELVGGDVVFLFKEIYRGDMALAFKNGIVNMGDNHIWLTRNTIVTAGQYDRVPKMFDWLHKAAGFIFSGVSSETLNGLPVSFDSFGPINPARCHQIACGWDGKLENAWISWPTTSSDLNDPIGIRRMTLIINPRYNKTTLVDHGFSSFALMGRATWETVRDFLLENSDVSDPVAAGLLDKKEGMPFNSHSASDPAPTCIYNFGDGFVHPDDPEKVYPDEDGTKPSSPHPGLEGAYPADEEVSIASKARDRYLAIECAACEPEQHFCMASAMDYTIKEFKVDVRYRETYLAELDQQAEFPNTSNGAYVQDGYPTVIQGECSKHAMLNEKTITRLGLSLDATPEVPPGRLYMQLGVTNSPHCVDWRDTRYIDIDCLRGGAPRADENTLRAARPASFPFYRAGTWVAYRIFVADSSGDFYPTGVTATFNEVSIAARVKNETWTNQ